MDCKIRTTWVHQMYPQDTVQSILVMILSSKNHNKFAFRPLQLKNNFITHSKHDLCHEMIYSVIQLLYTPFNHMIFHTVWVLNSNFAI